MLELDPCRIDIWCAFLDELRLPQLLQRYWQLIDGQEQAQARRFHFAADRHRYLVTRVLVRTVLSRYAPLAPEQWRFVRNAYGKPSVDNDIRQAARMSFNLSHSRQLVVLGVGCGQALGIDTEHLGGGQAPVELAARYFCADEAQALAACPSGLRGERFYHYWTLKESYIKARGMGLSIPLDQFGFAFGAGGRIGMRVAPGLDDQAGRWRFWQWRPAATALVALCAQSATPQPPRLVHKRIIPMVEEQVLDHICPSTSF